MNKVIKTTCPTCGAGPGDPCHTTYQRKSGTVQATLTTVHVARNTAPESQILPEVFSVACPRCGAQIGETCRTGKSMDSTWTHHARKAALDGAIPRPTRASRLDMIMLQETCPTCGAVPGQPCCALRTPDKKLQNFHAERRFKALDKGGHVKPSLLQAPLPAEEEGA